METLRTHFSYENDLENVSELYENLSRQLKIIHSNNMVVPNINSDEIYLGESMAFKPVKESDNYQMIKRQNIVSFSKLMIGTYLSLKTGFKDFSNVDDQWFIDNMDTIFSTINEENFDKDYFSSVLLEGNDYYYSDYLDRKRQSESLEGKSNIQGYRKVLKTAGSELYQNLEYDTEIKEKNANIHITFNPLLIGISLAVITILVIMIALVK
jgi:hypothetical protein